MGEAKDRAVPYQGREVRILFPDLWQNWHSTDAPGRSHFSLDCVESDLRGSRESALHTLRRRLSTRSPLDPCKRWRRWSKKINGHGSVSWLLRPSD